MVSENKSFEWTKKFARVDVHFTNGHCDLFLLTFFFILILINIKVLLILPGCEAQSVGHLTHKSGVLGSIPGLATYFHFSIRFFKKGSCQLLAKVCARSMVNRLGGLSLPRKSVVRLTDRADMTLDVYRVRKTTIQQPTNTPYKISAKYT